MLSAEQTTFTYRTARSGGLVFGLSMAIVVETIALHALLMRRHPIAAWLLTASSLYVIWWLISDYRAMGSGTLRVGATLDLDIGRRASVSFPSAQVASVTRPTWRERPKRAPDYLNATKPAEPNVLIVTTEPVRARLTGGVHRSVTRIGLHVDEPEAFVAAVERARS